MEEPRLDQGDTAPPSPPTRMSRLGVVLINLPWLMLLILWWLWPSR